MTRRVQRLRQRAEEGMTTAEYAVGTLAAFQQFVVVGQATAQIKTIRWIEWSNVGTTAGVLALVAVVLSIIPTLIATRRFLRV